MSEETTTDELIDAPEEQKFEIIYSCLRCATKVTSTELDKLPEIKCICGFRVFIKVRPPLVKSIKAI